MINVILLLYLSGTLFFVREGGLITCNYFENVGLCYQKLVSNYTSEHT